MVTYDNELEFSKICCKTSRTFGLSHTHSIKPWFRETLKSILRATMSHVMRS